MNALSDRGINGRSFLPIELRGVSLNLGEPGGITRLDLTLGEDIDGDGLPDAWEKALMQPAGSLKTLMDLTTRMETD